MPAPDHLVIVCGHGIWLGGPAKGHDESEWLIESYKAGETPTFVAHIKAGLQVLADDPRALVAFSGGPTRKETPLSEGRSYANLAAANDYFGLLEAGSGTGDDSLAMPTPHPPNLLSPVPLHHRILVEEQALDSYYNILFSLLGFWRHTSGAWPARLTIVSHGFKRSRLVETHCGPDALAFLPLNRIAFIGINPPNLPAEFAGANAGPLSSSADAEANDKKREAMQGAHHVVDLWAEDPHGIGAVLAGKRRARNPWAIDQRLFASQAERQRSGLATRRVAPDLEALADDSPRPWNSVADVS